MIYKNILIPINGSQSSDEIVEFFCSIQPNTQANLNIIYVLEVPRNLPLNTELPEQVEFAKKVIGKAEKIAAKYQTRINTSIIYARSTEDSIITTAEDLRCDVIALAQDKHKLSVFANTAANIYQRAKCNVWLFNNKI